MLNCLYTKVDVLTGEDTFGPDLGTLKGKTVRCDLQQIASELQDDTIPLDIKEHYHDIILAADVMHVNGIPMLVTKSRNIHFGTVDVLPQLTKKTLKESSRRHYTYINKEGSESP